MSHSHRHNLRTPTLLINRSTQSLLADIFEAGEDLFSGFPLIRGRVVLWGNAPVVVCRIPELL
jgi:hypothetical protein